MFINCFETLNTSWIMKNLFYYLSCKIFSTIFHKKMLHTTDIHLIPNKIVHD